MISKIKSPYRLSLIACVLIAACSTPAPKEPDIKDIQVYKFKTHGKVDKINYWGSSLYKWQVINDQTVVIWIQKSQAYLLKLQEHCVPLQYATGITFRNGNQTGSIIAHHSTLTAVSKFDSAECSVGDIYKVANKDEVKAEPNNDDARDEPKEKAILSE